MYFYSLISTARDVLLFSIWARSRSLIASCTSDALFQNGCHLLHVCTPTSHMFQTFASFTPRLKYGGESKTLSSTFMKEFHYKKQRLTPKEHHCYTQTIFLIWCSLTSNMCPVPPKDAGIVVECHELPIKWLYDSWRPWEGVACSNRRCQRQYDMAWATIWHRMNACLATKPSKKWAIYSNFLGRMCQIIRISLVEWKLWKREWQKKMQTQCNPKPRVPITYTS